MTGIFHLPRWCCNFRILENPPSYSFPLKLEPARQQKKPICKNIHIWLNNCFLLNITKKTTFIYFNYSFFLNTHIPAQYFNLLILLSHLNIFYLSFKYSSPIFLFIIFFIFCPSNSHQHRELMLNRKSGERRLIFFFIQERR